MTENTPKCPECGSQSAWKYGTTNNSVIGYVCRNCTCHYTKPWAPPKEGLKCPTCSSQRLWRDGSRYLQFEKKVKIQCWLCKDCGYRFSQGLASMKDALTSFAAEVWGKNKREVEENLTKCWNE